METGNARNCWETMGCAEEKRNNCIVYQNKMGDSCWLIGGPAKPKTARNFKNCWDCAWFKELNPNFNLD